MLGNRHSLSTGLIAALRFANRPSSLAFMYGVMFGLTLALGAIGYQLLRSDFDHSQLPQKGLSHGHVSPLSQPVV